MAGRDVCAAYAGDDPALLVVHMQADPLVYLLVK